jgi:hypothetical protein
MGTRKLKKEIFAILARPELETVLDELARFPAKEVVNALFSAICQADELVRWHAVSGMGVCVRAMAEADMEEARIIMRRFLWSLNDESGGIGWGAPESMGEIMHEHEGLAREYAHMLISYTRPDGPELEQDGNFLEHEILQRGLLWGLERMCDRRLPLLLDKGLPADIPPYLGSADTVVRGLAVKLCGRLGVEGVEKRLGELAADTSTFTWYHEGAFLPLSIAELARQALAGAS